MGSPRSRGRSAAVVLAAVVLAAAAVYAGVRAFGVATPTPTPTPSHIDVDVDAGRVEPEAGTTSDAGASTIACGDRTCAAGVEVCCGYASPSGGAQTCVTVGVTPEERARPGLACRRIDAGNESVVATECDDSTDCGPRRMCCAGISFEVGAGCVDVGVADPRASVCELNELCVDGTPCAQVGARCVSNECVQPHNDRIRCMNKTCTPAAPYCCESKDGGFACATAEACDIEQEHKRFECTRTSDCAPGLTCCLDYIRGDTTKCMLPGAGIVLPLCEKDADCPPCGDQPARCTHVAYSGSRSRSVGSAAFKVCACVW